MDSQAGAAAEKYFNKYWNTHFTTTQKSKWCYDFGKWAKHHGRKLPKPSDMYNIHIPKGINKCVTKGLGLAGCAYDAISTIKDVVGKSSVGLGDVTSLGIAGGTTYVILCCSNPVSATVCIAGGLYCLADAGCQWYTGRTISNHLNSVCTLFSW